MSEASNTLIESQDQLTDFIRSGEKPPEDWKVGTEHEKIGLLAESHAPLPYEGERGIASILEAMAREDGWDRIHEGPNLIALVKDGASITLEPGGQLELSGAPLRTIHETCSEFHDHLELVRNVSGPRGVVWLSLGINPLHDVADIPRMPKARYRIMREYLPTRAELPLHMMHLTATVQANLDFSDEEDMVRKLRTALGVSPIVSAIFANSSIAGGKASGFASRRVHIWRHTDPDRCGLLPFVFQEDFGYERYVEWALDVPLFFIVREGRYLSASGTTFREFMERGIDGHRATLGDWDLHLTTLFPEVRLKRVIEVRGTDAVPAGLICALPALWKGLLYDAEARAGAWDLVQSHTAPERMAGLEDVARRGLAAELAGRPVLELARELIDLASGGLSRIRHAGRRDPDERGYLDPIRSQLERGRSPGEEILERWEGAWGRSVPRLIEYARY
ncbi:MAG: glutamate--cysteine ligase [bacterium]|nr:glutamate--cysteine ligase [bacterium]